MAYAGYYAFIDQGIPAAMAAQFIGPSNLSTIISISTTLVSAEAVEFANVSSSISRKFHLN